MSRLVKTRAGYSEDSHVPDCLVWRNADEQTTPPLPHPNTSGRIYTKKAEIGKSLDRGYNILSTSPRDRGERAAAADALRGWPGLHSTIYAPHTSSGSPSPRAHAPRPPSSSARHRPGTGARGSTSSSAARAHSSDGAQHDTQIHDGPQSSAPDTVMDAINGWPPLQTPLTTPTPSHAGTPTGRTVGYSDEVKEDYLHAYPWTVRTEFD